MSSLRLEIGAQRRRYKNQNSGGTAATLDIGGRGEELAGMKISGGTFSALAIPALVLFLARPVCAADWLIDSSPFRAAIATNATANEITLENGLVRRVFKIVKGVKPYFCPIGAATLGATGTERGQRCRP